MKQRGVALIIVLMVVAFVAIIAIEMAGRLQVQLKRTSNIKDNNQAFWYAMGAEAYARKTVAQLMQETDPINSTQPWAQESIMFPMPNGGIEAELIDMQTCFNLNVLRKQQGKSNDAPETQAFERLLQTEDLQVPSLNRDILKDSLVDWLDDDNILYGSYGAEDPSYESLVRPYLAGNNLMASKSELRLVKGIEPGWLTRLLPYVCVIPGVSDMKINVNTLRPDMAPVLAAVTGMSLSDAENTISNIPYQDKADFLGQSQVASLGMPDEQREWFVTETEYFILHVKSRYNNATFAMSSLLKVESENRIVTIRREFGGRI